MDMGGAFAKVAASSGKDMVREFTSAMMGSLKIAAGIVFVVILLGLLLLGAYLVLRKKQ